MDIFAFLFQILISFLFPSFAQLLWPIFWTMQMKIKVVKYLTSACDVFQRQTMILEKCWGHCPATSRHYSTHLTRHNSFFPLYSSAAKNAQTDFDGFNLCSNYDIVLLHSWDTCLMKLWTGDNIGGTSPATTIMMIINIIRWWGRTTQHNNYLLFRCSKKNHPTDDTFHFNITLYHIFYMFYHRLCSS